ncbi:flagellar hook-length control protein [Pseudescherichia vulneris NBRC 102420]|uniref:Flagellar hook-length control protein n=1 Tax=Pseudescherichia vulneris NBRC 102420 TaxID=1115515 RepID=A0A090V567_PSEVU|nr:flagellar hook length control protein FliK [Pseudescherichia vulneris]GAL58409.1 flagellar hook-length control protein [Pseudescherichia vulneris NBRC 102420]STQ60492.1 flagellar hook-length control protein [Pseudescherichia vulneris]
MITLPKLLVTDADTTSGLQTGKTATGAEDFLALLSGALSGTQASGEDVPLTLNDLRTAGATLQQSLLKGGADETDTRSPAVQLAALLARTPAGAAAATAVKGDVTDDAAQASVPLQSEAQSILASLTGGLKGMTSTATASQVQPTATTADTDDDTHSDLSDEELAGLSALLAMLPHQQTATPAVPKSDAAATSTPVTTAAGRGADLASLTREPTLSPATKDDADGERFAAAVDGNAQTSQLTAAAPLKNAPETAVQAVNTSVSVAPAVTTAAPAQASAPVAAPVISAPLGSSEWQQTISQNITLFTRQGQQSAELRLHPEDLGQVQISLKIDDNQAQLQMVSQHSHVRAALEAALPVLRTQLAENGIQLGQSSISSESSAGQQHSSSQQQQASRSGHGGTFAADEEDALTVPASLQSRARGNGAVDIFA